MGNEACSQRSACSVSACEARLTAPRKADQCWSPDFNLEGLTSIDGAAVGEGFNKQYEFMAFDDFTGNYVDVASGDLSSITQSGCVVTLNGPRGRATGSVMGNTVAVLGLTGTLWDGEIKWSNGTTWALEVQRERTKLMLPLIVPEVTPSWPRSDQEGGSRRRDEPPSRSRDEPPVSPLGGSFPPPFPEPKMPSRLSENPPSERDAFEPDSASPCAVEQHYI